MQRISITAHQSTHPTTNDKKPTTISNKQQIHSHKNSNNTSHSCNSNTQDLATTATTVPSSCIPERTLPHRCPRLRTDKSQRQQQQPLQQKTTSHGIMYTHSVLHAHFSDTFSLRGVQTSRTRMAQGVCSAHVILVHLTLSILMFHPPSLLFPDGHFETTFPALTSAPSLQNCSRSESSGQAHFRTSAGRSHALHRL